MRGEDPAATGPGPRRILVVTYWSHADALVQAYTLPYLRIMLEKLPRGSHIHLITLEKGNARSIPTEAGITVHPTPYRPFGAQGTGMILGLLWRTFRLIHRERIDTIHAWCTPAGMIGYLLAVLTGRPLVIDSYEPHAEAMVENGTWRRNSLAFRVLFFFERLQTQRASALIACAEGMQDYARSRYGLNDKPMFVKPACVDLDRFAWPSVADPQLARELGVEGKLLAVYAGKFGGIYLDQEVFDLLRSARAHWGDRFHTLLLTAQRPDELKPYMEQAGLPMDMFTIREVPHAEVPRYMGLGHFALTPVRPVPTKRYCTPVKDGEYWALGLPVIITRDISDDSRIIAELGIGSVLSALDGPAYENAVAEIDALLRQYDRSALYRKVRAAAERYRDPALAHRIYEQLYGGTAPLVPGA